MKILPRQFALAYWLACEDKNTKQIEEITKLFLKKIRAARAWKILPAIISHLQNLADKKEAIAVLTVETAHTPNAYIIKKITDKLGFIKTRVKKIVSPEILGGFIARTEDTIFDGSLKTQLEQLKKHLQS